MSRIFHSVVVCGASLGLLHCGGRSKSGSEWPTEGESGSGAASAGSGGTQSGGGGGSQGGIPPIKLDPPATAGKAGAGGTPSILVDPTQVTIGPDQQWACGLPSRLSCSSHQGDESALGPFALYQPCQADLARPRSQADCAAGEALTCAYGRWENETVLFDCQCAPIPADGICDCPPARTRCSFAGPLDTCADGFAACGCPAITCIL